MATRFLSMILLPLMAFLTVEKTWAADAWKAEIESSKAVMTAEDFSAAGKKIELKLKFAPRPGTDLMVVRNTGLGFIEGEFSNLRQGQAVTLRFDKVDYRFIANYFGGSGNDLELIWPRGGVAAWGRNNLGQLGNGGETGSPVPVAVDTDKVLAGKSVISAAGGEGHFLVTCADGTLAAWGDNRRGQLGNGRNAGSAVPVRVVSKGALKGKVVVAVAAGKDHSVGLCSDGTVVAWGANAKGQLGNGTNAESAKPVSVAVGKPVVAISAGRDHTLALCADGSVVSWGGNESGQLGTGDAADRMFPVKVDSGGVLMGRKVIAISAGSNFSLALCSDGTVAAWGANRWGQLGDRSFATGWVPVEVRFGKELRKSKVVAISAGGSHALALCKNGRVLAWGKNKQGQLGIGGGKSMNRPVAVVAKRAHGVREISARSNHSLARRAKGTLLGWGRGKAGELGNGVRKNRAVPVEVARKGVLALGSARILVAGGRGGLVISSIPSGPGLKSLVVKGVKLTPEFKAGVTRYLGQVADAVSSVSVTAEGKTASIIEVDGKRVVSGEPSAPVSLKKGLNMIRVVSTGANGESRNYALKILRGRELDVRIASGESVSSDLSGLAPDGLTLNLQLDFAPPTGAVLVLLEQPGREPLAGRFSNLEQGQTLRLTYKGLTYKFVVNYHGGDGNDMVLLWAKQVAFKWGNNQVGQLADAGLYGTRGTDVPVEVSRDGILAGKIVTQVSSSSTGGFALCLDGTLVRWGNGDSIPKRMPQTGALAGKTVVAIRAGERVNLAICSDGTVAAWGSGTSGELGNGKNEDSGVPVAVDRGGVLAGKRVVEVVPGVYHCMALCEDGTVVSWGSNYFGSLGNGGNQESNVPVSVTTTGALHGKKIISISAGFYHSVALCSDGTVVVWGRNLESEKYFNAGTPSSNVPVAVRKGALAGRKVTAITAGTWNVVALCSDQTLVTWSGGSDGTSLSPFSPDDALPVILRRSDAIGDKKVVSLAGGGITFFAKLDDGDLVSWGQNDNGSRGDGTYETAESITKLAAPLGCPQPRWLQLGDGGIAIGAVPLSDDSALAGFEISDGVLNVEATSDRLFYDASVSIHATGLRITPTVRDAEASVTVGGIPAKSGETITVPLENGSKKTVIRMEVTAENGSKTVTTINAHRAKNVEVAFGTATDVPFSATSIWAEDVHLRTRLEFDPAPGTSLMLVNNTGLNFIEGNFRDLAQGQVVELEKGGLRHQFLVNYFGGDGNDLVLEWKRRVVVAWGSDANIGTGNGGKFSSKLPIQVAGQGVLAGKDVVEIAAGAGHTLVLCSDGTLAAWGGNAAGELGDGTRLPRGEAMAVDQTGALSGKQVVAISAGDRHSLVLCADGTLASFGLGDGAVPVRLVQRGGFAGKKAVRISSAGDHDLALCADGSVIRWKTGIAPPMTMTDEGWPQVVSRSGILANRQVSKISAGAELDVALCTDGTVVTWMDNGESVEIAGILAEPLIPELVEQVGLLASKTVVDIAAGDHHRMLRCSDGSLFAWGEGKSGALGTGFSGGTSIPEEVVSTGILAGKSVVGMALGRNHSLAFCADGTTAAWGDNRYGQLGIVTPPRAGSIFYSPVSVDRGGVLADKPLLRVSARANLSVALAAVPVNSALSGLVVNSGYLSAPFLPDTENFTISIGASTRTFTVTPTAQDSRSVITVNGTEVASGTASGAIEFIPRGRVRVVATAENGSFHEYFLEMPAPEDLRLVLGSADVGGVISHGFIATGWEVAPELGFDPSTGTNLALVNNTGAEFIQGSFSNLAQGQRVELSHGGKIYPFVANYHGGDGNDLVLEWANRSLMLWGQDYGGTPVPMADAGDLTGRTVTAVAAGYRSSLALCSDGTVASWGYGENNLGLGGVAQTTRPTAVNLGGRTGVAISSAAGNALVLCSDNTLLSWGSGSSGALGTGQNVSTTVPLPVDMTGVLAGKVVVGIAVGGMHSLAVCSDGTVAAWGGNGRGQLGDGTTTSRNVPVLVSMPGDLAGKKVVSVSAGLQHSLALCSDGTLLAWGDNQSGQLGNKSFFDPSSMVPIRVEQQGVLAGKTVVELSQAAHSTGIVRCSDGTLISWGQNSEGQAGSSSPAARFEPVLVNGTGLLAGKPFTSVASGGESSLAVCADGTLVTWGSNRYGELGILSPLPGGPVKVVDPARFAGKKPIFGTVAYHCVLVVAEPLEKISHRRMTAANGIPQAPSELLAWVLPGDANGPRAGTIGAPAENDGKLVFRFTRLAESANGTIQVFQISGDLVVWKDFPLDSESPEVVLGAIEASGSQTVTVTVTKGSEPRIFGRVKVVRP